MYPAQILPYFMKRMHGLHTTRVDFDSALEESLRWLSGSAILSGRQRLSASFILSDLMWDFESAREIAEAGVRSNPTDSMLLNNLSVCLLELGRLNEAEEVLGRIKTKRPDKRL